MGKNITPGQAAAERVANHADVVGRAGKRGHAVFSGGGRDVHPQRSGLDADERPDRVDVHTAHGGRFQQDGVVQIP
jgi:hypothetical protein